MKIIDEFNAKNKAAKEKYLKTKNENISKFIEMKIEYTKKINAMKEKESKNV
ncbi:hypothetical protein SCLARK_00274 [Spiroplasma clarkii]|nr:hypothetical protein [Spiroplasma clarkii]ARU91031.1 hypothetical protein SCLARK_00274 [Spiroplasma clarkii]